MAKHRYELLHEAAREYVFSQRLASDPETATLPEVGDEIELDLSAEQRRAMIAAGWISEPLDADEGSSPSKSKGGKT